MIPGCRLRGALLPLSLACALAIAPAASNEADRVAVLRAAGRPAEPLPPAARRALLDAYAPVVILAGGERALPAHAEWYLAQARLVPARGTSPARLVPRRAALGGSADPADWTAYGHVYRAEDGGVLVQYWFFYPYNEFHGIGDHEADWEHVTVRLDQDGHPLGAWYARHDENAPGAWLPWNRVPREGDHPVVLAAQGSHASYARRREVPWYESVCSTGDPERAEARGCRVWRTASASTGGVADLGTRAAPAAEYLLWPGRWGSEGGWDDDGAGPPGPAFQPGWCSRGAPGCE